MAGPSSADTFSDRFNALRDREPDPFDGEPTEIAAFVRDVGELLSEVETDPAATPSMWHYLREASRRQVKLAATQASRDRGAAVARLNAIFGLGTVPDPDGRYEGELLFMATGLGLDGLFDSLTNAYMPWLGKKFDAAATRGDNVFTDNVFSKGLDLVNWPAYRVTGDSPEGTVRLFPFVTYTGLAIGDAAHRVLKLDYEDDRNPGIVRRVIDEVVELPGGYLLGKAHGRGFRDLRLAAYFGLSKASDLV